MKKTIFILSLVTICLLLGGAGYRFYLSQYEEECYQYGTYVEEYCIGYWSWTSYKEINGTWQIVNLTKPICRCGFYYYFDGCLRNRTMINMSNCVKYHLVRNVK